LSCWVHRSASTSLLSFGLKFDLALVIQFQRDQLTCPMADAVGDIVPCDIEDEDPAVIEDTAHDDVGMSMAGVAMVDCDPVQTTLKVLRKCTRGSAAGVRPVR